MRVYPLTIHCSWEGPAPVESLIDGSATLVMLTSRSVMNSALQHTASAIQRRRSWAGSTAALTLAGYFARIFVG